MVSWVVMMHSCGFLFSTLCFLILSILPSFLDIIERHIYWDFSLTCVIRNISNKTEGLLNTIIHYSM